MRRLCAKSGGRDRRRERWREGMLCQEGRDEQTAWHVKVLTWDLGGQIVDNILAFKDPRCAPRVKIHRLVAKSSRPGHRDLF